MEAFGFGNAGFLIVAVALISVPIIIHLINRMRFKRIRWAAMEFLLKAQKRTRRRLIIEQLLLLALRCLMIGLVGVLVLHFHGCDDTGMAGKPNLHLVLLDDTPSMQDQWKEDGQMKNCFDVAKNDILIKKIAKGLSGSKTSDRLVVLPLSKINDSNFEVKSLTFERLSDPQNLKKASEEIADLQPSMIHTPMLQGLKKALGVMADYKESHVTLHIVSDYRHKDWGHPNGDGLLKDLVELAKANKNEIKIRAIDTAYPTRAAQGGFPKSNDNVGIVEIRPSTRIVGKNMPVQFAVILENFSGAQAEVKLVVRDEAKGQDLLDVDFVVPKNPADQDRTRIRLSPSSQTTVTFDRSFNPEIKAGETHFAHLSVRLANAQLGPLENDGLLADNLRHSVVEVRDKVPILILDGSTAANPQTRRTEEDRDSFFVSRSLISVPGASYHVVYAEDLVGRGDVAKVLERPDLNKYPTIFLLNVPRLNEKQTKNLENFVREGGGVVFFMGDHVDAANYNRFLYKDGKGVFPAPLKAFPNPKNEEPALEPKGAETFQLIVRDEKFPSVDDTPIFGKIDKKYWDLFRYLPMRRYWPAARSQWKPEPDRVFELATLPNDAPATAFDTSVADIIRPEKSEAMRNILANQDFAKFQKPLRLHLRELENIARAGSEAKAFHLANQIEALLNDRALADFWANNKDDNVQAVRRQLKSLREDVQYGDPFIITQSFGKGKAVAVLSTAGKDWNDFAGGSLASYLYPPFIWELQNYLSSQGSEANLTVGTTLDISLDAGQFQGTQLKLVRHFLKTENEKPERRVPHGEPQFGRPDAGNIVFTLAKNNQPGVYITELVDENAPAKPIAVYAHAFNIDTIREGDLTRVGSDELDKEFAKVEGGVIQRVGVGDADDKLVAKQNDFSESPWLFLIILLVLVAEQALAVHLSFHLKQDDSQLAPAGASHGKV